MAANPGRRKRTAPACNAPIAVKDADAVVLDMANLTGSRDRDGRDAERSSSAASPGVVSLFFGNEHYPTDEEYVFAIAEAMRHEYEAIADAGATVQLDCPDLAMGRHSAYAELDDAAFRRRVAMNIEALNRRRAGHPGRPASGCTCAGATTRARTTATWTSPAILDLVWRAKPRTVLFEAANPRHAHEWTLFEEMTVPDDKVICPGVIEPQSNYIEHPELVAQRIDALRRGSSDGIG